MKKESKNLGTTKACPNCKKVLVSKANFTGIGQEEIKCPHCGTRYKKEINQKTVITLTIITLILVVLGVRYMQIRNLPLLDVTQRTNE